MANAKRQQFARWLMCVGTLLLACLLIYLAANDPDARTWSLWKNTLRLVGGTLVLSVPTGVVAAILIHRTNAWGKSFAWFALIALLFIPVYLQAAGWDAWFGRQVWLWQGMHAPTYRMLVAIWIHAAASTAWVTMIVGSALMQIAPELEESASLDMSIPFVLLRVTLPLCVPAILLSCWWISLMTAAEMTVTDIYQVRTYAEEIYTTIPLLEVASFGELASQTAPRATWIMVGWVVLSLLLVGLSARHAFPPSARAHVQFQLGNWRIAASMLLVLIIGTIVLIPLANLCLDAGAFVKSDSASGTRGWSPAKFAELLVGSPWRFRRELGWTAVIGASAATMATILGIGLAWIANRRPAASLLTLTAITIAAAVPGPMVALAIIYLMNREASELCIWLYDRTILAPALAGAVRALPIATAVIWWGIRSVPVEFTDMASLDGLGFLGRIRHVVWPTRREVLIAAWCASFAFAAGDLAATLLVTPPGVSTLSIRIFGLLHAGVDDQVAAVCLINVLLCLAMAFVVKRLFSNLSLREQSQI